MARIAGSKSTRPITLQKLQEALGKYPEIPVQVSKGWMTATEEALGIDFGLDADEAETPATSTAPETTSAEIN